jgi:hypothetical protein
VWSGLLGIDKDPPADDGRQRCREHPALDARPNARVDGMAERSPGEILVDEPPSTSRAL